MKILDIISKVIAVVFIIVVAVQTPTSGAEKKAEAITAIKGIISSLDIPGWAKEVFSLDAVLGIIVDLAVKTLKSTGLFNSGN